MPVRLLAAALACAALGVSPALAGNCTLMLQSVGTLALSAEGARLGSEEAGGTSAVLSISSDGSSTLTVDAPTLSQYPAGFNPAGLTVEVAYRGSDVLSSAVQAYTASQTTVDVPNLISPVDLTINNRIVTTTGLAAGSYKTHTVVTCS